MLYYIIYIIYFIFVQGFLIYSGCLLYPTLRAGFPTYVSLANKSLTIIVPAPIVTLLPIFTSSTIHTFGPI